MAKAVTAVENGIEQKRLALINQSEDLGEARKALESAANIARGLWFTFMTLAAYLVIAVGSVTHRDLFLETPVRLPLLNAELPMVAFFWVAPLMLLVFHGYLLLNLKFLGDNARHYFRLVDETGLNEAAKETLFLQLPNFMMVQLLRERRITPWTLMGYALHAVVILTIVIGPVLTLLFLQMRFLPYHDPWVTMIQRLTIVASMIQILYFWPGIVGAPASRRVWTYRLVMYAAMFAIVLFSGFVATFPGERNYGSALVKKSGMADFLLRGQYNEVTGDRQSWFSDTLSLSDQDFVELNDDKLKNGEVTRSLRGRNLSEANLARADLRNADFSGAILEGANFRGAQLRNARFAKPTPQRLPGSDTLTVTEGANLAGADFSGANLENSVFSSADLRRAVFNNTDLSGANFDLSILHGANFSNAKLTKASFKQAVMRAAYFRGTDLNEADFTNAELIGTALISSQLKTASFASAKLDASAFVSANVFGLVEQKPVQDTWLETIISRRPPPALDWTTTLVHGLKSEDRAFVVKKEDTGGFTVAELAAATNSDSPGAVIDPALKARDIESKAVRITNDPPQSPNAALWRKRTKRLVTLICLDRDYGATIFAIARRLAREEDAAQSAKTPRDQLLFGPFNADAASILLSDPDCRLSLKIKPVPENDSVRDDLKRLKLGVIDLAFTAELRETLTEAKEAAEAARAKRESAAQKGENSALP